MRLDGVGGESLERGLLLGEASFDKLALNVRQSGLQQTSITGEVVAVRADAGEILIEHRRHS